MNLVSKLYTFLLFIGKCLDIYSQSDNSLFQAFPTYAADISARQGHCSKSMEEIGYSRISLNLQSVHTPLQSFPRHALSSPPSPPPSVPPPSLHPPSPPPPSPPHLLPTPPRQIPPYTPSSSPPPPHGYTLHSTGWYHPSCLSSISILTFIFHLLPLYSLSGCFPFFLLFISYLIFSFSTFSKRGFLFPSYLSYCIILHVFLLCSFTFSFFFLSSCLVFHSRSFHLLVFPILYFSFRSLSSLCTFSSFFVGPKKSQIPGPPAPPPFQWPL